jgi:hypothetical protein
MRPPDRTCSQAWTPSDGPVSSRPRRRASPTPQVNRVDEEVGTAPRDHMVSKPMTRPDRRACLLIIPRCSGCPAAGPPRCAGTRPVPRSARSLRPARRPQTATRPAAHAGRGAGRGAGRRAGRGQVPGRDRRVGRGRARAGPGRAGGAPPPVDGRLALTRRGDRAPRAGLRRPRRPGPRHRRLAGRPAATDPAAAGAPPASGGRGGRQDAARQRPPPKVAGPLARRDGPHQPRGPRPGRRGGHHQRDRPVPAAVGGVGPRRHCGHRRRAPHPTRARRLAGHRQARRLPADGEGQPAHPAPPAATPAPARGPRRRPHPRPRPRPRRAPPLAVTTVAGLDFPHAAQAIRITRRVRSLHSTATAGGP